VPVAARWVRDELERRERTEQQAAVEASRRRAAEEAAKREAAEKLAEERSQRQAAERAEKEAAQRRATNQTLIPLGKSSVKPVADEWADASQCAVQQGAIRVRVTDVRNKGNGLWIELLLENTGPTRASYLGWTPGSPVMTPCVTDDSGRSFAGLPVKREFGLPRSLGPKECMTDCLNFEFLQKDFQYLLLELPAAAFGGSGQLRLRIPENMLTLATALLKRRRAVPTLCEALKHKSPSVQKEA
jgi:hypothetical protein